MMLAYLLFLLWWGWDAWGRHPRYPVAAAGIVLCKPLHITVLSLKPDFTISVPCECTN